MSRLVRALCVLALGCLIAGWLTAMFGGPKRLFVLLGVSAIVWAVCAVAEDELDADKAQREVLQRIRDGNR